MKTASLILICVIFFLGVCQGNPDSTKGNTEVMDSESQNEIVLSPELIQSNDIRFTDIRFEPLAYELAIPARFSTLSNMKAYVGPIVAGRLKTILKDIH